MDKCESCTSCKTCPYKPRWKNKKPTQEGWYWHHVPPAFGTTIEFYDPELDQSPDKNYGEWAGPIPYPMEDEDE